eukprot:scaffold32631_cov36-Tisochrysis_lutea.AAC.3
MSGFGSETTGLLAVRSRVGCSLGSATGSPSTSSASSTSRRRCIARRPHSAGLTLPEPAAPAAAFPLSAADPRGAAAATAVRPLSRLQGEGGGGGRGALLEQSLQSKIRTSSAMTYFDLDKAFSQSHPPEHVP